MTTKTTSIDSTAIKRPTLTFSIEGFLFREVLVIKTFLRLLSAKTINEWRYESFNADNYVDLLIVEEGVRPSFKKQNNQLSPQILELGKNGSTGNGFLPWPLQPMSLERELNRLGLKIVAQRCTIKEESLLIAAINEPRISPGQPMKRIRLQQWPPPRLLSAPGRIRLATILTGKAITLDELVQRSAQPLAVCEAFVNDLHQTSLLVSTSSINVSTLSAAPSVKSIAPSLLNRIRIRLGI